MNETESADPPSQRVAAVILAAGQGTRMRSALPKVLHPVAGRPMVCHVVALARQLGCDPIVAVVGHGSDLVRQVIGPGCLFVEQAEQLGTAHAVAQARSLLEGHASHLLVLYGDAPLVTVATLSRLLQAGLEGPLAILTAELADPRGYGRVVRQEDGRIVDLIEEREADAATRRIREVNSGVMCVAASWLWPQLATLPPHANGEYYLTDLVPAATRQGLRVQSVRPAEAVEVMGVNDRAQLAVAHQVLWERKRQELMAAGVTLVDPRTVYADMDVIVGPDSLLHPQTHLRGATVIGQSCEVGPGTIIQDSTIGDHCRIVMSVIEHAEVAERVQIGPFAHVRPGARIEADVELGNFSEVKASVIGAGTKAHHFSYIGDAVVGQNVNVGAGTITCNYDGQRKHRTTIGNDVFLGSDTMLVAPVTLADGARTGAGAVVTRDVAAGQLVVGVPARPVPGKTPPRRDQEVEAPTSHERA